MQPKKKTHAWIWILLAVIVVIVAAVIVSSSIKHSSQSAYIVYTIENGTVEQKENVPLIPVNLIMQDSEGAYVNVKNAADDLERRDITTGLSDGTNAEVTSGLVAGDQIWSQSKDPAAGKNHSGFPSGKFGSPPQRGTTSGGN